MHTNPRTLPPAAAHYPMRFNPYAYNPLSLGAKIAIGVATVGAVGIGAFLLWPREAKAAPSIPPQPGPPTPPQPSAPKGRPSGHPPPAGKACYPPAYGGSNAYDQNYWDAGGTAAARARIFAAFDELGYSTPPDRDTMNALGPNAELGGGDDVPNAEVDRFQNDYNAVSRAGDFLLNMGGLDTDGLVGPCTLNGLKYILDNLGDEDWPEIVSDAKT